MGRRGYPAEFRRKVLDLVQAGRSVADVARDLDISTEKTELAAANKRIAELGAEQAIHSLAGWVLGVSESGFYAWRDRGPSARSIRHVLLTDTICQIHGASNGVYDVRRVRAELTLGRGMQLWHGTVAMLMSDHGVRFGLDVWTQRHSE